MSEKFVYVTYIRTTQQQLWDALLGPEFQKLYWFGMSQECAWEKGAPWTMKFSDGRVADAGEIEAIDPPHSVVIKWRNEFRPELKADGFSRATYLLESVGDVVRLTVTHEAGPQLLQAVSGGWPRVLASLKSYLETGAALPEIPKT